MVFWTVVGCDDHLFCVKLSLACLTLSPVSVFHKLKGFSSQLACCWLEKFLLTLIPLVRPSFPAFIATIVTVAMAHDSFLLVCATYDQQGQAVTSPVVNATMCALWNMEQDGKTTKNGKGFGFGHTFHFTGVLRWENMYRAQV